MMVFLATAVDQQQPFDFRLFVFSAGGCFFLLLLATGNSWLSSYGCRVASHESGNRFCWLFWEVCIVNGEFEGRWSTPASKELRVRAFSATVLHVAS